MITLYRKDIPSRGSLFYGRDLILFMRGFRYLKGTTIYQLENLEVNTPEGTLKFHLQKRCLDFLWVLTGEDVSVESSFDYNKRKRHLEMGGEWGEYSDIDELFHLIDENWVDEHLSDLERYIVTSKAEISLNSLSKLEKNRETPTSRYAKTEKGQLSQKRYRESEKGKDGRKSRRKTKVESVADFKVAQKWIDAVEGRTYEDYLTLQQQTQEQE